MATPTLESNVNEKDNEKTIAVKEIANYRFDSITKLLGIIIFLIILSLILIFIYFMLMPLKNPNPVYFTATESNQLIQDTPLDKPNLPNNILLNWVTESMMSVHTFNFVNYNTAINEAKNYFTREGYESYVSTLRDTKILDEVISKKYVLRSVPISAPQITKEGVLANFYLWKIRLPMLFRYRNVDTDRYDDVELTLLIMRVPSTDAPYGIRILKYDLSIKTKTGGLSFKEQ